MKQKVMKRNNGEAIKKKMKIGKNLKIILKISSGTLVGQIMSVISFPILTYIYGAKIIGLLTFYTSIATIINAFADLGLTNSIMVEADEEKSVLLYNAVTTIDFLLSFISSVVVFFYYNILEKNSILNSITAAGFVFVLAFTMQQTQICYTWLNKYSQYDVLMKNPIINQCTIFLLSGTLGVVGFKEYGYFIGTSVAGLVTLFHMKKHLPKNFYIPSYTQIKGVLLEKNQFVKYQTMTNMINTLKVQLPTLIIRKFWGNEMLGYYSVSVKVLQTPIALLAHSIGRVYFQTISDMKEKNKPIGEYSLNNIIRAMKISILPLVGLLSLGDIIIFVFLGPDYKVAGELMRILALQYYFYFLINSSQGITIVLGKQKYAFYSGISQTILFIVCGIIGKHLFDSIYICCAMMTISFMVVQIVYFYSLFRYMKTTPNKYVIYAISNLSIILLLSGVVRFLLLKLNLIATF